MHILISPNAFKNSLNAENAASAIREGLMQSNLDCICNCFPIGDGGDGTGDLIIRKCKGVLISTEVHDPLGRRIQAVLGLIDAGKTAIIEMANASGLGLLRADDLNPLRATSFGTGEQIRNVLDRGVTKIIVGMGGSATVDGGSGILSALGIRFLNKDGYAIQNLPIGLEQLDKVDLSEMDKRILDCEIIILCDVDNPLLGKNGAARIFGPQKGATPQLVEKLETILENYSNVIYEQTGMDIAHIKYGGVAGGASGGLHALLGAKLVNGIDYYLQLTGFDDSLKVADLVITGEGSIDGQTLQGKGPYGVAKRAKALNIPVIGLAGKVPVEKNVKLNQYFDILFAIGNEPSSLEDALLNTSDNISRISLQIGNLIAQFINPNK